MLVQLGRTAATPVPNAGATPSATSSAAASGKWRNPHRRLPAVRWAVQGLYLAFIVAVGFQFAAFFAQARGDGQVTVHRPPAVEGFLPISALLGLKRFLLTRTWDEVHPAGLTILLAAIATAFVARKGFCSWVCPVGTISRALEWVGRRTLWRSGFPQVPRWLDLPLLSLKYLLLAFFVWTVFVAMPVAAIEQFVRGPYNVAADAKMLLFFTDLSAVGGGVVGALVVLSLLVKHFWCRYLCPYGALLGLASLFSPQLVRRDPDVCNDCRACTRACPSEIQVHAKLRVLTPECTGCMSCVSACTVKDCLGVTRKGARALSPWLVPASVLTVMLAFWAVARATGFWETSVPLDAFRWAYRAVGMLTH